MLESMNELYEFLSTHDIDAIVVEGYDGVGKGRVLSEISEYYRITPYRPDYNLWNRYDLRRQDRWKISGAFWEIFSHFSDNIILTSPLLFDRGVMSEVVYTNDLILLEDYKKLLGDRTVLHILVTCEYEDFLEFSRIRDCKKSDIGLEWENCKLITDRYHKFFENSGVNYLVYKNHYEESKAERLLHTCEGCGHYNYGICRHPLKNCSVEGDSERCSLSKDEEVQDIGTEMQFV